MPNGQKFVRLQATYRGRLGIEAGVFVAVDHLRRADRLSEDEEELFFDIDDWFEANLLNPPFYEDGNSVGAVTWFKRSTSAEMLKRLEPLCDILTKYGVEWTLSESSDLGDVILRGRVPSGRDPLHSERSVTGATGPRTWPDECRIQAPPWQESAAAVVKQFSARRIGDLLGASGYRVVSQNGRREKPAGVAPNA